MPPYVPPIFFWRNLHRYPFTKFLYCPFQVKACLMWRIRSKVEIHIIIFHLKKDFNNYPSHYSLIDFYD